METLEIKAQTVLTRKMTQKVTQRKRDTLADARIVEDGVINTRTAVTKKNSKKDRKITEKVQT